MQRVLGDQFVEGRSPSRVWELGNFGGFSQIGELRLCPVKAGVGNRLKSHF
jgi:hypothetical protein